MLDKAKREAERLGLKVKFAVADVEHLPFSDNSFDSVVSACVFCSVPHPIRGLKKVRRVLRPQGRLVMLEHVLSCRPVIGWTMNLFNRVFRSVVGANINRDTISNIKWAGFIIAREEDLWLDVFKFIVVLPNK